MSEDAYLARLAASLRFQRDMLLDSYDDLSERLRRVETILGLTVMPLPHEMRQYVERMQRRVAIVEHSTFIRPLPLLVGAYVREVLGVLSVEQAAKLLRVTIADLEAARDGLLFRG